MKFDSLPAFELLPLDQSDPKRKVAVWLDEGEQIKCRENGLNSIYIKAGSIASKFCNNQLIKSYPSEPVRLYILEIKIDVKN